MRDPEAKILSRPDMRAEANRLRAQGLKLAFTNGCFDLLHAGHARYLAFARAQADRLAVGLNSDASVRRAKGPSRPLVPQRHRARLLAALECVDYVVVFGEDEPLALIRDVSPDVLVKGRDWAHYVSGRDWVEARGGRVALAPLVRGLSTSALVERIRAANGPLLRRATREAGPASAAGRRRPLERKPCPGSS